MGVWSLQIYICWVIVQRVQSTQTNGLYKTQTQLEALTTKHNNDIVSIRHIIGSVSVHTAVMSIATKETHYYTQVCNP